MKARQADDDMSGIETAERRVSMRLWENMLRKTGEREARIARWALRVAPSEVWITMSVRIEFVRSRLREVRAPVSELRRGTSESS